MVYVKMILMVLVLFLAGSCFDPSPCDFKIESMNNHVSIIIKNISDKSVLLASKKEKVSFAVKKKMGSWSYDLNNLTRVNGTKKLAPNEVLNVRKVISKYDKNYKYKLELTCNGKKIESKPF